MEVNEKTKCIEKLTQKMYDERKDAEKKCQLVSRKSMQYAKLKQMPISAQRINEVPS